MNIKKCLPIAEQFFEECNTAIVELIDWDFPHASIKAKLQTYRGDFFEEFTRNDYFHVEGMHNLSEDPDVWFLDIKFKPLFTDKIIGAMTYADLQN